jgi:Rieske Fe-S protein
LSERLISRGRFLRLGGVAGLGSVGAAFLAACGGETGEAPEEEPAPPADDAAPEDAPEVAAGDPIAAEADVPENSALSFTDSETGQPALLLNLGGGEFVAYSAVCTHRQCEVAYQEGTERITCPCHGSVFIPEQGGEVESGPATAPLPEIEVEVRDGEVFRA